MTLHSPPDLCTANSDQSVYTQPFHTIQAIQEDEEDERAGVRLRWGGSATGPREQERFWSWFCYVPDLWPCAIWSTAGAQARRHQNVFNLATASSRSSLQGGRGLAALGEVRCTRPAVPKPQKVQ